MDIVQGEDERQHYFKVLATAAGERVAERRGTKAAGVKVSVQKLSGGTFDERRLGYATFRDFLRDAESAGFVTLQASGDDVDVLPGSAPPTASLEPPILRANQVLRADLWKAWVEWSPSFTRVYDRVTERALVYPSAPSPHERPADSMVRTTVAENPTRFVPIQGLSQAETLGQMHAFANTWVDPSEREAMLSALNGLQPAAEFTKSVRLHPHLGASWHRTRAQHVATAIAKWAAEHNVRLNEWIIGAESPRSPTGTFDRPSRKQSERDEGLIRARILAAVERMPTSELLRLRLPAEYMID